MPKRALIVIDVQNEYFDGALPISDPPTATSLGEHRPGDGCRHRRRRAGDRRAARRQRPRGGDLQRGQPRLGAPPRHRRPPHDHLVRKELPGSFTGTPLGDILADAGVDTVSITGYMTHMCVDTTAREAAHRGLAVEILNDATGTLTLENSGGTATGEELHRATLVAQGQFFAEVMPTEKWIGSLDD